MLSIFVHAWICICSDCMEHVNDCDFLAVESCPRRVLDRIIVDQDVFDSHHCDFGSFAKEDFFFVGVGGELALVHSKGSVSKVIVDADNEENHLLLGVVGEGEVERHFEVF